MGCTQKLKLCVENFLARGRAICAIHERFAKGGDYNNDRAKIEVRRTKWPLDFIARFKDMCMKYKPKCAEASPKSKMSSKLWFDKRQKQHTWL